MYKIIAEGKCGITAKIVADSIATTSHKRITTFELEYPRFIHSELMTHRLFSRNAMSSRAVPIAKMIEQVRNNPAMPIHWGKNQAGMQASTEVVDVNVAKSFWLEAAWNASEQAECLNDLGLHKQIVNRVLEPFQMMKTVLTATGFNNFFWLRCHEDAQPEIKELADMMRKAMSESIPEELNEDEWHTPYVEHKRDAAGKLSYIIGDRDLGDDVSTARKVSASCCAQVSYRVLDDSIEKALNIYERLVESKPVHASPFEHIATPMKEVDINQLPLSHGITHRDMCGFLWSGNFNGWIQYRQQIKDNVKCG